MSDLIDSLVERAVRDLRYEERKHARSVHTYVYALVPSPMGYCETKKYPLHDDGAHSVSEAVADSLKSETTIVAVLLLVEGNSVERGRQAIFYGEDVTGVHAYALGVRRDSAGRIMLPKCDVEVYTGNAPNYFELVPVFGRQAAAVEKIEAETEVVVEPA